jgi:hypothetical protein
MEHVTRFINFEMIVEGGYTFSAVIQCLWRAHSAPSVFCDDLALATCSASDWECGFEKVSSITECKDYCRFYGVMITWRL